MAVSNFIDSNKVDHLAGRNCVYNYRLQFPRNNYGLIDIPVSGKLFASADNMLRHLPLSQPEAFPWDSTPLSSAAAIVFNMYICLMCCTLGGSYSLFSGIPSVEIVLNQVVRDEGLIH